MSAVVSASTSVKREKSPVVGGASPHKRLQDAYVANPEAAYRISCEIRPTCERFGAATPASRAARRP